jgi:hypothetical protein
MFLSTPTPNRLAPPAVTRMTQAALLNRCISCVNSNRS